MEPFFTEEPRETPEKYRKFGFSLRAHLHFAEIDGLDEQIDIIISRHNPDPETSRRISTRTISPPSVLFQIVEIAQDEEVEVVELSEKLPDPHIIPRSFFRD